MRKTKFIYLVVLTVAFIAFIFINSALAESELSIDSYFRMIDANGNIIHKTSHELEVGDQFINEDNNIYEVIKVDGYTAQVDKIGEFDPSEYIGEDQTQAYNASSNNLISRFIDNFTTRATQGQGGDKPLVAIYHTHDAESFVPTEGYDSAPKGSGGIIKVGTRFAEELQKKGVQVEHDKTSHYPHDSMAYERSRRTATQLMKQNPAVLFDVHRDAVPPNVYGFEKEGKEVTKIAIVLGRQNPNIKANEAFAKKIKAVTDETHPGLIRGILFARGKYNQDLSPRAVLLEVGAHTNSREAAERGVALLSDAIPKIVGVQEQAAPGAGGTSPAERRGVSSAIGWIIGLAVLGGGAFLLLNSGSLEEVTSRIKRFSSTELASYVGKSNSTSKTDGKIESEEEEE